MLATPHYMSSAYNAFLPPISSPLVPRSANVYAKPRRFFMSSSDQENTSASDDKGVDGPVAFSKRPVKKAPSPKQDELKERRRKAFLKKVQDGRDEKRWETRGEDMMRLDFYQRQKQWEAEQALLAPSVPFDTPDEDEESDLPVSSWAGSAMQVSAPSTQCVQLPQPDDEVDEVLAREDEELAALLEYMPDEDMQVQEIDARSEHLWSDDEDYDALFSELMEREHAMSEQANAEQGEAMDTS